MYEESKEIIETRWKVWDILNDDQNLSAINAMLHLVPYEMYESGIKIPSFGNKPNNMNPNVIIKRNQKETKIENKIKNNEVETSGKYIIPTVISICPNINTNPYDYSNNNDK